MPSSIGNFEAERAELDAILASELFARTNNLVRLLTFVCEKHFEGATAEIKEYNIAVQALGRPPDFDPQLDTIVRVTAHALRKRLDEYYRSAGADHPVRICLPPGGYVPKFTHRKDLEGEQVHLKLDEHDAAHSSNVSPYHEGGRQVARLERGAAALQLPPLKIEIAGEQGSSSGARRRSSLRAVTLAAVLVLAVCILALLAWRWRTGTSQDGDSSRAQASTIPVSSPGNTVRALVGNTSHPYIDRGGLNWDADRYCSGGDKFFTPGHVIQGTEDPELFSAGRRGIFQCSYPLPSGLYEVHLLFAETSGFQENTRNEQVSMNGKPVLAFDVVDDAAGDDTATTKILTDVSPAADGMIHLDFTTPESFLNAVEILPGIPHRALPVRIVVGNSSYHDSKGNDWTRDRYFFGGRLSSFAGDLSKVPDGRLYEWHRFGHIHYIVPVATGEKYTVRLYFLERWFGIRNGGLGGVGSRVFDVSCNGAMLLKNFDIFREAGTGPLVKSFAHITPTAQGKIELYFIPGVNYPSISAIEIIPE
ncbi:MAG: malectin domain-containing carbohydrate-binding protein [Candidatus Acidiferrum sp.]